MANKHSTLCSLFTNIASAIRRKTGGTSPIQADAFPSAIRAIETTGGGVPGAAGDYRAMIGMVEGTLSGAYTNYSARTVTPYALRFCQQAETLAFPEASTVVDGAFYDLNGLKSINLNRVRELGYQCFRSCNNLETVNINACVSIHSLVFDRCTKLTSVTMEAVKYISDYAFRSCTGLKNINCPNLFAVGVYTFGYCSNIASIYAPKLEYVGEHAFYANGSLTECNFDNLIILDRMAFGYGTNIIEVNLPNVENDVLIGVGGTYSKSTNLDYAFEYCFNLQTVSIPKVKIIGRSCFFQCFNLRKVYLPNAVSISHEAFAWCSSLVSVNFPKVTYIGEYCFQSCSKLEYVSLPLLETNDRRPFQGCTALKSVSFPNLKTMSASFFTNCTALSAVYLLSTSMCRLLSNNAFQNTPMVSIGLLGYFGSIYVPPDLVLAYQTASNWSLVSSRITAYQGA